MNVGVSPHVPQANLTFDFDSTTASKLGFEWVAQDGFVAAFAAVASQFVAERNLKPVRVAVIGPPGSGKSTYATALGTKYYLPLVRAGDAVALALGRASEGVVAAVGVVRWPEGLRERVAELMTGPQSRLPVKVMARVVHALLSAPRLRNRGYGGVCVVCVWFVCGGVWLCVCACGCVRRVAVCGCVGVCACGGVGGVGVCLCADG